MAELEHDDDGHQTTKGVGKSHGDAQAGNIDEHNTSVREALLNHRWAVMWSLTVSMSVIMEGYDTILMGNFLGFPAFQKQFGEYHGGEAGYQVAAAWRE
ncbi:hypothetical protein PG989_016222 [Apiospora arundinis]